MNQTLAQYTLMIIILVSITSCSAPAPEPHPQRQPSSLTTLSEVVRAPRLESSGKRRVVINPNRHTPLRIYWICQKAGHINTIMDQADVPPGQSVEIGSDSIHGVHCTYEITGWVENPSRFAR